jgi:hypothetical protein
MGVERCGCVDGTNSPIRDFVGPAMLASHCGCHGRDSGVVFIESRGSRAPAQEGPSWSRPAGVLPVCVWCHLLLMRLLLPLFSSLNSKGDFCGAEVVPRQLQLFVGRLRAQ